MTSSEIRNTFLDFFSSKKHKIVPSSSLILKDDPSLMFVNAGMNPFKDIFIGSKKSESVRIANTQKCLRVSGKHNDLEEVGLDTYHHTLFEMLGNWSFGDYFKEEAIDWAWELLTEVYGLDKNRIYITVFEGDLKDGISRDIDSEKAWLKYIDSSRILSGSKKDNFWEMGEVGPCGPCSEIHIDLRNETERKKIDGALLVNEDHPQVIELWNLVFIEFQRVSNGNLNVLPEKHVDTGMGLERLVRAIEMKESNYDTDLFTSCINKLSQLSNKEYGDNEIVDVSFRVISDHIRAVSMAIADGQLPSNVGAGYVIRRILRRAVRYGYSNLGFRRPFLIDLLPVVSSSLSETFPELETQISMVKEVIREEESSFLRTLESGLKRLDDAILESKDGIVSGIRAFELYDTFGFPLDLTKLICSEKRYNIDEDQFQIEMKNQKDRSRSASNKIVGDWVEISSGQGAEFIGYEINSSESKLVRYRYTESSKGKSIQVVIDPTPFYPEGGGQVGDIGTIKFDGGDKINVTETTKETGMILHYLDREPKVWSNDVFVEVNMKHRTHVSQNHSATHLIHFALRKILGSHVEQRGSLVHADGFRFDFSHFQKVSDIEIEAIESLVRSLIADKIKTQIHNEVSIDSAKKMGAMALFGEKYGDLVRVVQFGDSVELCGGTHVEETSNILTFIIKSESGIAAGIRRIEALSGKAAVDYLLDKSQRYDLALQEANQIEPVEKIKSLKVELLGLEKKLVSFSQIQVSHLKTELIESSKTYGTLQVIAKTIDLESSYVKDLVFQIKDNYPNAVVLLVSVNGDKVQMHLGVGSDSASFVNAGNWVKELSIFIKGGGGGQPSYASSGGKFLDGVNDLIDEFYKKIEICVL
ncbi:alanine--tRNA ligase [Schleiferiaceae bacterium]|nr:alanine--tRNA ligase [Schleiferiaceae bacterium]